MSGYPSAPPPAYSQDPYPPQPQPGNYQYQPPPGAYQPPPGAYQPPVTGYPHQQAQAGYQQPYQQGYPAPNQPPQTIVYVEKNDRRHNESDGVAEGCLAGCCAAMLCCCLLGGD